VKWANQKTVPPNYSEMPIVFTLFSLVACLLDFIYDIYSYSKWASCKGPFVSLDNTSIGNHTHTRTRAHMQYAEREREARTHLLLLLLWLSKHESRIERCVLLLLLQQLLLLCKHNLLWQHNVLHTIGGHDGVRLHWRNGVELGLRALLDIVDITSHHPHLVIDGCVVARARAATDAADTHNARNAHDANNDERNQWQEDGNTGIG
jgi:hypothetical protein